MGAGLENLATNYEYQDEPCIQEYLSNKEEYNCENKSETKNKEIKNDIKIPNKKSSTNNVINTVNNEIKQEDSNRKISEVILFQRNNSSNIEINDKIKENFNNNNDDYSEYTKSSSSSSLDIFPNEIKKKADREYSFTKNSEDICKNFMGKLIKKNVWQKEKNFNSIIIFDWDDTLLPTSYLRKEKLFYKKILPEDEKRKIEILEKTIYKVLEMTIAFGKVYIITNSGMGWIEYSILKFYPKLKEILKKVNIISARNEYEDEFPGDAREWKVQTFLNIKDKMDNKLVTNIICLGDSSVEIEAAKILASEFLQAFIKTVKFKENPKPLELNRQLELFIDQFNYIYSLSRNLSIRVGKK